MSEIPTHDSKGREIVGWLVEGHHDETIALDIDEAIEREFYDEPTNETHCNVRGYVRRELPPVEKMMQRILENTYEELDEEYGGDDVYTDSPVPTDRVEEAARILATFIREDFFVWQCEASDVIVTVELKDYIEERPLIGDVTFWG